jgi:hypothetical protein
MIPATKTYRILLTLEQQSEIINLRDHHENGKMGITHEKPTTEV